MLYSCTRMATVGVKGLTTVQEKKLLSHHLTVSGFIRLVYACPRVMQK